MKIKTKLTGSVLLTAAVLLSAPHSAEAYGPEGLFGGRPQPDSSIVLGNPAELKNDRPERAESVLEHPRPDYDAVPYAVGSFELYPTLEFGASYDDNIFVEDTSESADAIGTIRPIVNLFSNWGRHALSITTFGDINYYSQHPNEDYKNAVLDINGRYDIVNQTWLSDHAGYQRLAESRTSPDNVIGSEPTTFGFGKAGIGVYRGAGLLKAGADYDFHRFDYDNTPSSLGPIDQSIRNRNEHYFTGKLSYEWSGNVKPYAKGTYNVRTYDHDPSHDSTGFEVTAGVEADLGGITSIDVYGGYLEQYYDDRIPNPNTHRSPKMGARVDWNVTGLTSLVFEGTRTIEETSLSGYDSYYQTGGSVTVTHELLRNVLLEGAVSYSNYDFLGTGDRNDDYVSAGIGARYLINRSLYADIFYNWDRRDSNEDAVEYTRNAATLRLGVHF